MAGISSKAAGGIENKTKYNGMELQSKEFSDGVGLEMYEYKYRFYDHQIGKFISQDRLADKYNYYSPYQFAGNEVPNAIDLDGLEPYLPNYALEHQLACETKGGEKALLDYKLKEGIGAITAMKMLGIALISIVQPQIGIPLMVSDITRLPVTPSPQAMAGTAGVVLAEGGEVASDAVSLTDKSRVLTSGGEIGMMDGSANLAVDAKTGFFNIKVNSGSETGIITGEINVNNNQIGFNNIEITNAKGGLGSIEQQNTIGVTAFNKIKSEITDLTKAAGYDKATVEFSRLRPPGSKLPDTDTRTITLFDNTVKK